MEDEIDGILNGTIPNTQYPHRANYVGPDEGKAIRDPVGDVVTAGLAYGTAKAINPILRTIGPAGVIDAGLNMITGESDTAFEKKLEIFKPAKVAVKSVRIFKDMLTDVFDKRVSPDYYTKGPLETIKTAATGGLDIGTARNVGGKSKGFADETGASSSKFYDPEFGDVLANADPKNVELLKKIKLTDDESRFVLGAYYKIDRDTAAAIQALGISVDEFNDTKDVALPYLLKAWSNIKRKRTPQLDHVNQLKAALPFFIGRQVKEFPVIAKILLEEGIFGGHSRKNFKYLEFDVHSVKSAYWRRVVGGNGEKFFANRDISTPEKLRAAAKEYAQIINESNRIVNNAIDQYKLMNQTNISAAELDEFVNRLGSERLDPKNAVKQVRELLTEMEEDGFIQTAKSTQKVEKSEIKSVKKQIESTDKRQQTLERDADSVQRRAGEIQKFIKSKEKKFKGQYPLGFADEQLQTDAETIVREMKKNRALRENIQGTIFDTQNEAAQIEAVKKILWERTGRSRKK